MSTPSCACAKSCGDSAQPERAATLLASVQPQRKGTLMSVLDPRELQASPLADLHALAAELGLEGFRRLRKEELIDQIVQAQGGTPASVDDDDRGDGETALYGDAASEADEPESDYRAPGALEDDAEDLHESSASEAPRDYQEPMPNWEQEGESKEEEQEEPEPADAEPEREEDVRSGVLDVLPNGSGFIRAEPY